MENDRSQIEAENASVLHFLFTPVRILMDLGKWLVVGSLVIILVLVNQVGWVVDLGERSQRGRVAHNNQVEGQIASGGFQSVFDIDFRTQPDVTAKYVENYDRFWDDSTPFGFSVGYGVTNRTVKAFSLRKIGDGWGQPDAGIPYCMAALHVIRPTNFFNDTPDSWWAGDDHPLNRNDDALDRKSARMQRDYEVAAMMTAALRSTLAHMKLGRPVIEVRSPLYEDDYRHRPADPGYCDADSAAHDPRYGDAGTRAYRATLLRINLQHAPVVRFRYVGTDPESMDTDITRSQNQAEIWGMCLPDSCTEGYGRGTTLYADLFASHAPLTDEQMLAEAAIMAMTTKDFWEQAARENGITDMTAVEEVRKRAVNDLNLEFAMTDFRI